MGWFRFIPATGAVLMAVMLSVACAPGAYSQPIGAAQHVDWSAESEPATVEAGEELRVVLEAQIGEGWKMYAMDSPLPTRGVEVAFTDIPGGISQSGALVQAQPKQIFDPNFGIDVRIFEGSARLWAPFVAAGAGGAIEGEIDYMICNERLCLPPTTHEFSAPVEIVGAGGAADPEEAPGEPAELFDAGEPLLAEGALEAQGASERESGKDGIWAFLLLAAGAGFAALLTPCVFPMIPLTVSYFTKHSGRRQKALRMAGVYGLTIVLTFTGLGVAAAIVLGAAGAQSIAANPWVNLFIGAVFIVFAFSLLGLFELRLPNSWVNYFNRQSNSRGGYAGVFFMGLTLTLVSFSCTAPFVGGLLAATTQGAWTFPILGMLAFSTIFALPFIVFALFPRGLEALPRSGGWMSAVKVTLGFVELAAALKFLSNADLVWGLGLLSRPLVIAVSSVIFLMTGMYLLGKLRLKHEPVAERIGVLRLMAAIGFIGFSLYLLPGPSGAPLGALDAYLPPREADAVPAFFAGGNERRLDWHDNIDVAFERARQVGKPVFIDFTGYTCTNCRDMEANVFPAPPVKEHMEEDFVLLRLYTDNAQTGKALQQYQLDLVETVALPTYAIVHPTGSPVLAKWSGVASIEEFARFLTSYPLSAAAL